MDASVQTLRLSRPSGTLGIFCSHQPSDKSLGYCQMSLRDKGLALPARKSSSSANLLSRKCSVLRGTPRTMAVVDYTALSV